MLRGSLVAIVTPFKDGEVDYGKLEELVEYHISKGTDGIVPVGTTGESPTLSHEEHMKVVETVVKTVKGRIPVVAGAGSNSTREAISLTRHAKNVGADAVLSITPYYNKPTQNGLIEHFTSIANAVDIPIVMYNVPGRTGVKLLPETIAKLSEIRNIVAIKEACGSIEQVCAILSMCDITVVSGDDSLTFPMLAVGGKGVISVAANIIPKEIATMISLFDRGKIDQSREIHYKYWDVFKDLFIETNPIPVKAAMDMMGLLKFDVRSPLCPMVESNKKKLRATLEKAGLVK
jgi:4-hydroxy-tetrahydrodipicolinate synthase